MDDPKHVASHLARNLVARCAGGVMRGTPHLPGTREYFTCLDGKVTIIVAGERYDLGAGDVLAFPGNLPHSYKNADGKRNARGVSVVVLAKAGI
jgi:quercetin dioxygenase-like cupin family protein